MVDFLDAFPLRMGWLVRFGYWLELRYAPWSYEATYRLWYLLPILCRPVIAFVALLTGRRLRRWIAESRAEVIVSTYPLASLALAGSAATSRPLNARVSNSPLPPSQRSRSSCRATTVQARGGRASLPTVAI